MPRAGPRIANGLETLIIVFAAAFVDWIKVCHALGDLAAEAASLERSLSIFESHYAASEVQIAHAEVASAGGAAGCAAGCAVG